MGGFGANTDETLRAVPAVTLERCIIVEELRMVYVPVPKAACTSLRWMLADLIGLPPESFEDPAQFRVTQGQTIQNVHRWPPRYVLQDGDTRRLEEVAGAEDWLRFTVIRDPARRLWSAWQSKVLLRQPGFVRLFGEEPWFPAPPTSPEQVLEGYERFVAALGQEDEDRRPKDPHWRPQTELLGGIPRILDHVGKVETLGSTLEIVGERAARFGRDLPPMRRENATPLPYPDGLLSEDAVRVIRDYYAADYRAFDYDGPEAGSASGGGARGWTERTRTLLPSVRTMISHNERLTALDQSLQESRRQLREARRQAAEAQKSGERLRREVAKRDGEIFRLRGRMKDLRERARMLHEIQQSSTWRYTAPLRRLVSAAKGARGRLRGGGKPGQDARN